MVKLLLFKPPNLWYFVTAVRADEDTLYMVIWTISFKYCLCVLKISSPFPISPMSERLVLTVHLTFPLSYLIDISKCEHGQNRTKNLAFQFYSSLNLTHLS